MPKNNKRVEGTLTIENASIMFRNFKGEERTFNPAGKRNFCVRIDDLDFAKQLQNDGWNIKYLQPQEGDPDGQEVAYLPCEVSFKNRPPMIKLITKKNQTVLDESTIDMLDYADIKNVDLIITPYNWEVSGKSGVKAYVKTMYVVIEEDAFASKYEDTGDLLDAPPF